MAKRQNRRPKPVWVWTEAVALQTAVRALETAAMSAYMTSPSSFDKIAYAIALLANQVAPHKMEGDSLCVCPPGWCCCCGRCKSEPCGFCRNCGDLPIGKGRTGGGGSPKKAHKK